MNKKVVYLATPYYGKDGSKIKENVNNAEKACVILWKLGYAAIPPHVLTKDIAKDISMDNSYFYDFCLSILKKCDVALFLYDWKDSIGCKMEHVFAKSLNIPTYYSIDELNKENRS